MGKLFSALPDGLPQPPAPAPSALPEELKGKTPEEMFSILQTEHGKVLETEPRRGAARGTSNEIESEIRELDRYKYGDDNDITPRVPRLSVNYKHGSQATSPYFSALFKNSLITFPVN